MKKLINIFALCFIALSFIACQEDDEFTFIASPEQTADFTFTNSLAENYSLSPLVANNPAERFVWNEANFDVQTPISYQLESSTTENGTFSEVPGIGSISVTNQAVTIGNMITLANEAGLDNDPDTEAPNTGTLYFRVRAYVGSDAANVVEQFSDVVGLNIELIENTVEEVDLSTTWGVVGDATIYGWDAPDVPMWKTDLSGVDDQKYVAYTTLTDGEIKFRENEDWGNNYGGSDGNLVAGGDNIAVTAGTYKINIDLNELTYSMEEYSWGIVGDATPNGWDGPDVQLYYNGENNTWMAENVTLTDGEIKFRLNNDWGTNFGGSEGNLANGGDNIAVTAGTYTIIVDFENGTYTIE
ncbi:MULTISPECIES: SusF/SusE family outer membrane protein [Mesonia]|uniref:Uncharacterized protein n=1 Tax=Mesonia oceanica TaxID=2687242 RepID=A0AC61Y932_9FLAO|nr:MULTISPECIES: SusF/SusE family outer membrane protein [Mesonia]MAN25864.1 hypothetical protein [Mesonia sp.]MAN27516.1 hypothetical protein [Mesonia sp.]MAQ40598.1 hypothetical protein [Mesonia sp.]VVV01019.1 hypothetical protein FVB9532_02297 [Mesonia oceanica]|tara:strand:+ start:20649 stop:21716 length:1068 start_codon:yes stop_codon:yes gene_type:complete